MMRARKAFKKLRRSWVRSAKAGRARRTSMLAAATRLRTVGIKPETKYVGARVVAANFNRFITNADLYPVCPGVSQGVGDYQRLGTKIRGKYLYIRGTVTLSDDMNTNSGSFANQALGPIVVRLLILSSKNIKSNSNIGSVQLGQLLDDRIGTGATRSFNGDTFDLYAPLNKDMFTVHMDRKIKLIPQNAESQGVQGPYMGQRTHAFTCRIPAPKSMTFDDTTLGSNCANFAPFLTAGWGYANDRPATTIDVVPVNIQAISTLYFTDA